MGWARARPCGARVVVVVVGSKFRCASARSSSRRESEEGGRVWAGSKAQPTPARPSPSIQQRTTSDRMHWMDDVNKTRPSVDRSTDASIDFGRSTSIHSIQANRSRRHCSPPLPARRRLLMDTMDTHNPTTDRRRDETHHAACTQQNTQPRWGRARAGRGRGTRPRRSSTRRRSAPSAGPRTSTRSRWVGGMGGWCCRRDCWMMKEDSIHLVAPPYDAVDHDGATRIDLIEFAP